MSDIRFNRWLHQSGTGGISQDSTGNIGIGTTIPITDLDVRGDVNIGDTININNASGIISATTLTATTGTFSGDISVTGNASIAGTLTYEDVSNIDAVGIITAQSDILIGRNLNVTGVSTGTKFNSTTSPNYVISDGTTEKGYIGYNGNDPFIGRKNGVGLAFQNNKVRPVDGDDGSGSNNTVDLGEPTYKFKDAYLTGTVNSAGINATGVATATTFSGNLTGNVTGDLTGNLAGISSIAAIDSTISDTATDVFVYDTSKDSDGGAWRKRTQHTSWYNETLNTATRGSRKEFPAVAVIVVEDNGLTIYDGDDPDLPMWMKWTSTTMLRGGTLRKLAVKNGIIALSTVGTYNGLIAIYFISDTARSYRALASSNNTEGFWKDNIAGRNDYSSNNYSNGSGGNDLPAIVAENTNDVAMTVLPNAPIDPSTGLPVPTIAVATAGGVSIIKDDGTVVDLNVSNRKYSSVYFSPDNLVWAVENPSGVNYDLLRYFEIPTADITTTVSYGPNSNPGLYPSNTKGNIFDSYAYGSPVGLSIIDHADGTASTGSGMVAYATTSYNTGWMHGDIKSAFLSDTDTTNASPSSNLVNNGDFADTNLSNYFTLVNSDANGGTESSSAPYVNGSNQVVMGNSAQLKTTYNLVAGRVYKISYDCVNKSTGAQRLGIYVPSGASVALDDQITAGGTNTLYYTATSTASTLIEWRSRGSGWGTYDNFTVIESTELDRSINNKGLAVIGTITKTPVATGADLVAYSGYSSSNYLVQPSITAPGTGDFSVTCWIKPGTLDAGTGNYVHIFSLGTSATGGQGRSTGFTLKITTHTGGNANGYSPYLYNGDGGTNHGTYDTSEYIPLGKWSQLIAVRRGGVAYIYHDGELMTTGNSWTTNLTDTYLTVFRGIGYNEYGGDAKVALLRYSSSAPTAEQIKKMYEDEKVLFQENAKATLYGSSDAVTALASDDTTNLLHVGTSAGRSEFRGLSRINNTTDAVTTAISASNGLVAEQ